MSLILYVIKFHSFLNKPIRFLGLDNVDFENQFANELMRWIDFKPFKTVAARVLSDIGRSAVAS